MSPRGWDDETVEQLTGSGYEFFVLDPGAPGGLRPMSETESAGLREAIRGAEWEPVRVAADSMREDVPLNRMSDADLARMAEMARVERDFGGEDPEAAASIARAVDREIERRDAAYALDALLDRADELQVSIGTGSSADAAVARQELVELDAAADERTRDAGVENLAGWVGEYVALMAEDPSPEVDQEARARRESIQQAMAGERPEAGEAEREEPEREDGAQAASPTRSSSGPITRALEPDEPEAGDEEPEP